MSEVSRHLFIPRRPLIASMLSSDPERSWIRIVKASLISSTRPALISADLAARNIDHELSGLAEIAGALWMLVGHDRIIGSIAEMARAIPFCLIQTDPLPKILEFWG
jgi:hypothetical protein